MDRSGVKRFERLIAGVLGLEIAGPRWLARTISPMRAAVSRAWCAVVQAGLWHRVTPRRFRRERFVEPAAATLDSGDARRLRAIFVSDLHLGSRGSQADLLLDFLKHHDADTIYLVGDIIDGWRLRAYWHWPAEHDAVLKALVAKGRAGTRLVYLPGNHDEFMRDYYGNPFGRFEVVEELLHVAADGRRYLVLHGDRFDVVVAHAKWLAHLGDWAYVTAMRVNIQFNRVRRFFGLTYWSLSAWAKKTVKNAVSFIGDFEETLSAEARRQGVDGVICGHIHHAAVRDMNGIAYLNCGDWVESCTALVENREGQFEIITWTSPKMTEAPPVVTAPVKLAA